MMKSIIRKNKFSHFFKVHFRFQTSFSKLELSSNQNSSLTLFLNTFQILKGALVNLSKDQFKTVY